MLLTVPGQGCLKCLFLQCVWAVPCLDSLSQSWWSTLKAVITQRSNYWLVDAPIHLWSRHCQTRFVLELFWISHSLIWSKNACSLQLLPAACRKYGFEDARVEDAIRQAQRFQDAFDDGASVEDKALLAHLRWLGQTQMILILMLKYQHQLNLSWNWIYSSPK